MKVFYRISESANPDHVKARSWQVKPPNATKKHCLELVMASFPTADITLFVDNITDETFSWLKSLVNERIYINKINAGSDAKSFRELLEAATLLDDHEIVLFQEDDYLYLPGAEKAFTEALQFANYVTGYLCPDKWVTPQHGGNPYVQQDGVSEVTRVVQTSTHFWMMTNSTTNTFATTSKTLKEDKNEWLEATKDLINTKDFDTFLKLRRKGRSVLMPIPTLSTHALKGFEAPLIGTGITSWEIV